MRTSRTPHTPSSVTPPSVNSHHTSFRSPLSHILPKHALFKVKLQIHQLSNVPLLGGEFGVKWRFKHVQSPGRNTGLLARIKANKSTPQIDSGKGKGRDLNVEEDLTQVDDELQRSQGAHGHGIYVNGFRTPSGGSSPTNASKSPASYFNDVMTQDSSLFSTTPPHPTTSSMSVDHSYSDGRGATEWAPLHEHTAKWQHTVAIIVRMDIDRETLTLQPNDLKLTVMQRVLPGDRDSPQPQRGVVQLNLAEYADAGPVTRRYLLRQSKTNATLKLTIELEHVGGERRYQAPPLQKSEILAQVSGLLSNPGFQRARFLRELETLENPNFSPGDFYNHRRLDGLASSQSIRVTEHLIESIFNPIPSTTASPFTREDPLPTDEEYSFDSFHSVQRSPGIDRPLTPASSSRSVAGSSSTNGSERPRPSWWKKVSLNRPKTPVMSGGVSG